MQPRSVETTRAWPPGRATCRIGEEEPLLGCVFGSLQQLAVAALASKLHLSLELGPWKASV
eukprot:1641022-Amphidinium_carterae.1